MKKRKTLKWLVIFVAVLLISMFFSRTVQTITTPKIQKIKASRGKLEEKIQVTPQLSFPDGEEIFVSDAKKLSLQFTEVPAQQGYYVKAGDLLARAEIPSLEEERERMLEDYNNAIREMGEHIASNIRAAHESPHNQVYEAYFEALTKYYEKLVEAEAAALIEEYELPEEVAAWGRSSLPSPTPNPRQRKATPTPVPLAENIPDSMKAVMQETYDLWEQSEIAFNNLKQVYIGGGPVKRVGDNTFEYIKTLDSLKRSVREKGDLLIDLDRQASGLREFRAPHNGYLISFTLKRGETFDGSKELYTISKEGELPFLKVDITDVQKPIEKGTKVEADKVSGLVVSEIRLGENNRKFAYIQLSDEQISQLGGISKLMNDPPALTLVYKSAKTTTLVPASAVRTDADGTSFVYVINQQWGGMLSNTQFTVAKQKVTVLERSNTLVSVAEDINYLDIADREDRTISDGQAVMEYVD
ncbi:MAG: hypothetical protein QM308_08100 [Bacillota bacterium]|nr:hypothetical protein [Bacillota bacterium]